MLEDLSAIAKRLGWTPFYPSEERDWYDAIWRRPENAPLTGKDRILGIIDQPLKLDHPGYKDRFLNIEYLEGARPDFPASHGAAVVSIATDKHFGIAPNAAIVYRAIEASYDRKTMLFRHYQALKNLKAYVEAGNHLDAISSSHGWIANEPYAKENDALVAWFEKRNIPVFSTIPDPVSDADETRISCGGKEGFAILHQRNPAAYIHQYKNTPFDQIKLTLIPIDHRALACSSQEQKEFLGSNYFRATEGGSSWVPPFASGLFVAAREANPAITKKEFYETLRKTAQPKAFPGGWNLPFVDTKAFMEEVIFQNNPHPNTRSRTRTQAYDT